MKPNITGLNHTGLGTSLEFTDAWSERLSTALDLRLLTFLPAAAIRTSLPGAPLRLTAGRNRMLEWPTHLTIATPQVTARRVERAVGVADSAR